MLLPFVVFVLLLVMLGLTLLFLGLLFIVDGGVLGLSGTRLHHARRLNNRDGNNNRGVLGRIEARSTRSLGLAL